MSQNKPIIGSCEHKKSFLAKKEYQEGYDFDKHEYDYPILYELWYCEKCEQYWVINYKKEVKNIETEIKYVATCPRCDNEYPIEEEQDEINCPVCHHEIDWEFDRHWIKEAT